MADKLVTKLIVLFFVAQILGLLVLAQYIDFKTSAATGTTATTDNYLLQPPTVENQNYSFISIIIAVIVGTIIVLWLIKLNALIVWKLWFMTSISVAFAYAVYPLFHFIISSTLIAIAVTALIAIIVSYLKIFKVNYIAHTISELLIYGGLAAIFVPILNVVSATVLLVLLAGYDYYMVNRAGHMVTLAKASMDSQMISGLYVGAPKSGSFHDSDGAHPSKNHHKNKEHSVSSGVMVGGGDIAFPLFFAGALMKFTGSFTSGLLVAIFATIGLMVLFAISKRGRFYPAIPFVATGCFVALGISFLI